MSSMFKFAPLFLLAGLAPASFAAQISSTTRAPQLPQGPQVSPFTPGVVYVNTAATGANNGMSWNSAYTDLQTALGMTTQGQIWVAGGTYYPGLAGDQAATFALKSGVALYGGFAGNELALSQRDVQANPSVLSGDINQDDTYGSGSNWWQFGWSGSLGNSYHVVTGSGTDATAILDGFSIVAGVAGDPQLRAGGGLLVVAGSPNLRNCTFQYNALGSGSSAYLDDCGSVFESCIIRDAYACNCGWGGWTSGVLVHGASNVTFLDTDFLNHYYVSTGSQGRGAALNVDFGSSADLIDCRFIGNQTGNFYPIGGGTAYGAGVFAAGDITLDRCVFLDNFAHAGAGLTAWGDLRISNSLFARNRSVTHPSGGAGDVGGYGGGLLTTGFGSHIIEVTNCTFVDNNCDKGAGMAFYGSSVATVRNSIAYDNYANPTAPGEDTIWILKQQLVGNYDIAFSCVEGLLQTEPGEDPPNLANFPGCIDISPSLVDMGNGDYHLAAGSPCIDAADNTVVPMGLLLDLDLTQRFQNDLATTDTGIGSAPVVDMGCYELPGTLNLGIGAGPPRISPRRL